MKQEVKQGRHIFGDNAIFRLKLFVIIKLSVFHHETNKQRTIQHLVSFIIANTILTETIFFINTTHQFHEL